MGVSSRKCLSGIYLAVAKYAKAGNYGRESSYIEGEAGSKCLAGSRTFIHRALTTATLYRLPPQEAIKRLSNYS
jgi:hypothetical protein